MSELMEYESYDTSGEYDDVDHDTGRIVDRIADGPRVRAFSQLISPQQQQQQQQRVAQQPQRVVRRSRIIPIGFYREAVEPNMEVEIEIKPQVPFRGIRLAIPPSIARFFIITDLKCGKDSQLAASGPIAAECFSSLAIGMNFELEMCSPGMSLSIRVRNTDTQVHPFYATINGYVPLD